MEEEINRIVILENNVKGDLRRCKICKTNWSALYDVCIECEARMENNVGLLKELEEIWKL